MKEEQLKYLYDFKNSKVRRAFNMYAAEHNKTIQEILEEALKAKHPKLFKST